MVPAPPILGRPRLRGTLHAFAALTAVPAGSHLVLLAPSGGIRLAAALYAVTLVTMFAVSAGYHLGRWSPAERRRMKALDHVAIFCFVGGSYTPLAAGVLSAPATLRWLGTLWLGVLAGSVVKLRRLDRLGGPADVCYAVLTWWSLLILPALAERLSGVQLALLFGGLVAYSLAAAVLGRRRPNPWPVTFGYHELAHAVALGGTACHYVLYLGLLPS